MKKYFIKPENGFHFMKEGIKKIEETYGGKYVGYFCILQPSGNWSQMPIDVFYQPNPDLSKGHSHYFGVFMQNGKVCITNAISVTEQNILGIVAQDGEVVVSRYRHDFRRSRDGSVFIDGGRDYTRYGWSDGADFDGDVLPKLIEVKIVKDELVAA